MKLFVYYSKVILLNHLVRETLYNFATPSLRNTAAHVKDTRIESGGTCTSFNLSKEPTNNLPKLGLHHIPAKIGQAWKWTILNWSRRQALTLSVWQRLDQPEGDQKPRKFQT